MENNTGLFEKHISARMIAFYLPQYHPIPENDEWWGKGFTEWTNVGKAKPLFRGHYQPHVPADLGYYDLRVPEARAAQAEMAKEHGIEAFCYYHYWFAGKRILERPFNEVLESGQPDFPFCLCWANETWSGIWHGSPDKVLIKQTYPGDADYRAHFMYLLKAFSDDRYVTVDKKPLLLIYRPQDIPDLLKFTDLWREMAIQSGLKGLYLVASNVPAKWSPRIHGFDASVNAYLPPKKPWVSRRRPIQWLLNKYSEKFGLPTIYSYEELLPQLLHDRCHDVESFPCVIPNWDNTPRSGANGRVFHGSTPELFRIHLKRALEIMKDVPPEHNLVFIKSWNEWAEGNHLEPDLRFGKAYLHVLKDEVHCSRNHPASCSAF